MTLLILQSAARRRTTVSEKPPPLAPNLDLEDREGLSELLKAFSNLEFDDALQKQFWTVLAAVLHLGNVTFVGTQGSDVNEACTVDTSNAYAQAFCSLVGCSMRDLDAALCQRTIAIRVPGSNRPPPPRPGRRASTVLSAQTAAALGNATSSSDVVTVVKLDDAVRARDVLAKSLYGGLFEFVAAKTNGLLHCGGNDQQNRTWIGVLDIFGFEFFDVNGFEQLCINYANEKLQQLFTSMFIGREQVLYVCEAIEWRELDFKDNRDVIALFEQQHPCLGLFATLDEGCRTVGGSDKSIVEALCNSFADPAKPQHPKLKRSRYATDENFVIVHYAASVTYNCGGMLEKNRDSLMVPIKTFIQSCTADSVVRVKAHIADLSDTVSEDRKLGGMHRTLSSRFQLQIRALLDLLSEASSTFVRCIKPNSQQMPFQIEDDLTRTQLVSSGLCDCIRITQMGFPFRLTFLTFLQDNALLMNGYNADSRIEKMAKNALRELCCGVMERVKITQEHYKIGTTLIFFKAHVALSLEKAKLDTIAAAIELLQGTARRVKLQGFWQRCRKNAIAIQCCARSFFSKWRAMLRFVSKLKLQAYLRCFCVKRERAFLASASKYLRGRMLSTITQARFHNASATARFNAKLRLQAHLRAFLVKRSHVIFVSATRYLRGRLVAIALQAHAHQRFISAWDLRARMISSLAKQAHLLEVASRKQRSDATSLIAAMICRKLKFRKAQGSQMTLVCAARRHLIHHEIQILRVFVYKMQSEVSRALIRNRYLQKLSAACVLGSYMLKRRPGLRASFIKVHCGARVAAAASARALRRSHYTTYIVSVQPLEAVISRWMTTPHFATIRHSARFLQASLRASAVRAVRQRMAAMMSKKFLQTRLRRWSARRRYCARFAAAIVACKSAARAVACARFAMRVTAAAVNMRFLRRCCCQRRFVLKLVAINVIKLRVKMARARIRYRVVAGSRVLLAACKC